MSSIVRTGGSNVNRSADLRGLSTDTKPTAAHGDDIPHGSTWYNMDTNTSYMYNIDTDTWYVMPTEEAGGDMQKAIYDPNNTVANAGGIEDYVDGIFGSKADEDTISRVEDGTTASALISKGEQFYHENVLYEATADIAQGANIVTNGEGVNCQVAPKVTNQIQDGIKSAYELVEDTVGWTGKNLLNNIAVNKTTNDNFTFTVNFDKSVTISGTASANRTLLLAENLNTSELKGFLINGLPNQSGVSFRFTSTDYTTVYQEITVDNTPIEDNGSGLSLYIRVANGTTCNNVIAKPMIRRADIIDDTYEPYHKNVEKYVQDKIKNTVGWTDDNVITYMHSATSHHVQYTYNPNDKSTTISGTADATSYQQTDVVTAYVNYPRFPKGIYDVIAPTDVTGLIFQIYTFNLDGTGQTVAIDTRTMPTVSRFELTEERYVVPRFIVANGTTINGTYTPVISHISVDDELQEKADNSVIGYLQEGSKCSKSDGYIVGEPFIYNGNTCIATAVIAYDENLIENTNFVKTAILYPRRAATSIDNLIKCVPTVFDSGIVFINTTLAGLLTNGEITNGGIITLYHLADNTIHWYGAFGTTIYAFGTISSSGTYSSHHFIPTKEDVTNDVKSAYQLVEDTVGWSGKNLLYDAETYVFDKAEVIGTRVHSFHFSKLPKVGDKFKVALRLTDVVVDPSHDSKDVLFVRIGSGTSYSGGAKYFDVSVSGQQIVELEVVAEIPSLYNATIYMGIKNSVGWTASLTVNDLMVYDADIIDSTYEPYHASVNDTIKQEIEDTVGWDIKNYFTTEGIITANYLAQDGTTVGSTNWRITDYINISDLSNIELKGIGANGNTPSMCFYDSNKVYISGVQYKNRTDIITVKPSNAVYIRVSVFVDDMETIILTHASVDETKCDNSVIAPVENDTHPSATITKDTQFIYNGILYTATQDIATTDTITPNINCRESDSVTEQISDRMTYADNGILGAKNINGTKYLACDVSRGVTFVHNNDGTITATGINDNTGNSATGYGSDYTFKSPYSGKVLVSGGVNTNCTIRLRDWTTSEYVTDYIGEGEAETTLVEGHSYALSLRVDKGYTISSQAIFKPMIRLASDTDPNYQPYAQTNRELTVDKADNSVIGTVENGATASQAYAVGSHAIRNGAFITWVNAKAQGETINDASDYTSGDVGSWLKPFKEISVTPAQGVTLQSNTRLTSDDKICVLNFSTDAINIEANTNTTLLTIPSGYRPTGIAPLCSVIDSASGKILLGFIQPNQGTLRVSSVEALTGATLRGSVVWTL